MARLDASEPTPLASNASNARLPRRDRALQVSSVSRMALLRTLRRPGPAPYRLGGSNSSSRQSLPYDGDPLTPDEEAQVRRYIDFLRA